MKVSLIRARYPSVWEPTNLMYVSSFIKDRYQGNLEVQILDGFFDSDEKILNQISGSDYVGFSGTTPQVPHIKKLSKLVKKEYPSMKTVAGGYGPSLQPFLFLNDPTIDHLIVGEGEQSMLDVLNGTATEKLVSNQPIIDVDTIPNPDRDSIDLNRYIAIAEKDEGRRVTSIMTERGCAFGCTFCAEGEFGTIWRKADLSNKKLEYERAVRLRQRSAKLVVQEMLEVRDRFNITFFKMNDAETNPSKPHFVKLCKEMIKQEVNVPWGCNMRCDKVDDEMCELAVKANCEEFWMGLESGSPEIHRDINKGTTVEMIKRAFDVSKKYGIKRRTYALLGTPLESYETIKQTEELIDYVDPEIIGFSILAPYPGTAYWKPEYDKLDWSQIDEFSNTTWSSSNLTNEELRTEQARLIEKYSDKLAPIIRKKQKLGMGGSQTLDSIMGAM
ncbi:B12-binding domain-containing radical SAM protein [Nitrosopumilus sp. b3]|uniref:B12-binding domain-containing radical SAM protein n=1 Tax=Nitrosopumilus sp. b3 TaxID=2109909 RepID=UPI0015F4090D|nr:radical SAM protein [Nitrosopumilus sp. b3]KAF6247004.1 B12-binding domain-containing radical SAM protein [Nitrosopumilus sp. b3]